MIGSLVAAKLGAATLWASGALANLPPAEHWDVSANATMGSGLSLAGAGGATLIARSPAFLNIDVGFKHPQMHIIEFAPTLMMELEGRVSVGANAKIRAFVPNKRAARPRFRIFGVAGVPVFFVPFTLAGLQAGAGFTLRVHSRFSFIAVGTATGYVLGTDLMKGGALGKLDVEAGLRVRF